MNLRRLLPWVVILSLAVAGMRPPDTSRAANPPTNPSIPLPPVRISDNTFLMGDWSMTAEGSAGASFAVTQRLDGGFGGGPFRFMSHSLPPVSGSGLSTIAVTHLYLGEGYSPGVDGPITAIDYQEIGIILSFPFPDAFSTTQPVIEQGGRIFRSPEFIRFIAQNSSHNWEVKSLTDFTAADFLAVDGSGEHPDFSSNGGPMRFGFTRSNSRSSTLPPVPPDQEMVIDQGVDDWRITIYRDTPPPQAVDDVFVLNGYQRSLPLLEIFNVIRNDSGYSLKVSTVTEPLYGTAGAFGGSSVAYQLDEPRATDSFSYTISDGTLTSSARVDIYIDCACTVLCLNNLEPPPLSTSRPDADQIDLPLIYRVRDYLFKPTVQGQRYVDMYYQSNPEILVNILADESLRSEAVTTVELWQDNLRSLSAGDGSAVITQGQVDAIASFLDHLSVASSAGLQQIIADELQRLGPLDDYVGLTMKAAKSKAIGDPVLYFPMIAAP